jgi:hypothetical protein
MSLNSLNYSGKYNQSQTQDNEKSLSQVDKISEPKNGKAVFNFSKP